MNKFPLLAALALMLPACSTMSSVSQSFADAFGPGEYVPEYLRPDSPLDPPGTAAARKAMREKILKEGKYQVDAEAPVKEGKVFLLSRNPDRDESPSGKLVKTPMVKILACEGTYYFVETQDKQRGFVRESDLEDPVTLLSSTLPPFLPESGSGVDPALWGDAVQQQGVPLDENRKVMLNQSGRSVVVVGKKTEKGDEFARRREQMLQMDQPAPDANEEDVPLPEPTGGDVPLPEPTGGAF